MFSKKQSIIISSLVLVIVILFGVAMIFNNAWTQTLFSIGFHLCCIPIILLIMRNPLEKGFPKYVNVVTFLFAVLMVIEYALNFVRELLFGYTRLLSPLYLMAYIVIAAVFDFKERKRSTRTKVITFAITIPLLLLFVCIEVLTFSGT